MKKNFLWLISLLITILLLLAIFRKVDYVQVFAYWKQARPFPLLLVLVVSFFSNCWLASFKWKLILTRLGLPISWKEAFLIKMGSGPLKSILPFRSGEAARVVYLKRKYNFSIIKATASIFIELFFNILIILLFIALGGIIFRIRTGWFLYFLALIMGGVILIILVVLLPSPQKWIKHLLGKISNSKIRGSFETFFTLHRYFPYPLIVLIFVYSLIIQTGKLLTFYLINLSFDLTLPPEAYFVFLPLSILISTIPITILGIGLREGSLTTLISEFCLIAPTSVLGSALLFSVAEYVFPAALGLFWTGTFTARMIGKKKE